MSHFKNSATRPHIPCSERFALATSATKNSNLKTFTLTFKALHNLVPEYITALLQVYNLYKPRRNLRSQSSSIRLVHPKTRTMTHGDRCFTSAAPKLWNKLPLKIRDCETLDSLKRSKNLLIYPAPWLKIQKDYGIVLRTSRTYNIRQCYFLFLIRRCWF